MVEQDPARPAPVRSTELERQMRQIGERFLTRTLSEAAALRPVVEALKPGDLQTLHDLELFAHRIHGSGAMFGFGALSQCAGAFERQLASTKAGGSGSPRALDPIRDQFALLEAIGKTTLQGLASA